MKRKNSGKVTGMREKGRILAIGMTCCLLTGCGNVIPELTEEEASLIATYAADVVLESSKEDNSRLMDTEEETQRREDLSKKVEELREKKKQEEEEKEQEVKGSSGDSSAFGEQVENIAGFIGLDAFQVSYSGYEIKKSYAENEGDEWEPTFDATSGENLLIVKLKVTNITDNPAVADVLSKNMLFSIRGDNGINSMACVTMLLNDFSTAQDEIGAGESKEYVLITQIDESITETNSLILSMKKGEERASVTLQ